MFVLVCLFTLQEVCVHVSTQVYIHNCICCSCVYIVPTGMSLARAHAVLSEYRTVTDLQVPKQQTSVLNSLIYYGRDLHGTVIFYVISLHHSDVIISSPDQSPWAGSQGATE